MFPKKIVAILLTIIIAFLLSTAVFAASVGFVSSTGIFFSKDRFFAGEQVKVYSVIVNNTYARLNTTVAFLDNGVEFGKVTTDVIMEQARQISVSWVPTEANHNIVAKFISATGYDVDGNVKSLSASELDTIAPPISKQITVDGDIDHDSLGNKNEPVYDTSPLVADTDGDGLTDGAEVYTYKTNPAKADTDGDGMNDGDEIKVGRNPLVPDSPPPATPSNPALPTPVAPQVQNRQAPKPQTTSAPRAQVGQAPVSHQPAVVTTKTTPTSTISETEVKTETTTSTPAIKTKNKTPLITPTETNWVKVLGIIAALLAIAAGTAGFLAWREQNKY